MARGHGKDGKERIEGRKEKSVDRGR